MKRFLFLLLAFIGLVKGAQSYAGSVDSLKAIPEYTDTVPYVRYLNQLSATLIQQGEAEQAAQYASQALDLAQRSGDEEGVSLSFDNIGNAYAYKGNDQKALSSFIRSFKLKNDAHKRSEKFYYNMAIAFARLKQYPLALKYFHKAALQQEKYTAKVTLAQTTDTTGDMLVAEDSLSGADTLAAFRLYEDQVDITADERIVIDRDTILFDMSKDRHSRSVQAGDITDPFDDAKDAIAYGLILHIKQPVAGTRKAFAGINTVGHMFVTLVKYNADSGYVSRTFGFYPDKDFLLSATPLLPASTSVFKDDAGHDWDEMLAKFIPKRKFNRILRMVKRYSRRKYNLNKNNCTDFGLVIAGIAGIRIKDTRGHWPLGSGNNPGSAGQSVREGKIEQMDDTPLFVYPPLPQL